MTSDKLSEFLTFLRDTPTLVKIGELNMREEEDWTQDILHSLELEKHDAKSCARLARELAEHRKKRRHGKDIVEVNAPLAAWVEENRAAIKSLEAVLGKIRRIEEYHKNRQYNPRILKTNE